MGNIIGSGYRGLPYITPKSIPKEYPKIPPLFHYQQNKNGIARQVAFTVWLETEKDEKGNETKKFRLKPQSKNLFVRDGDYDPNEMYFLTYLKIENMTAPVGDAFRLRVLIQPTDTTESLSETYNIGNQDKTQHNSFGQEFQNVSKPEDVSKYSMMIPILEDIKKKFNYEAINVQTYPIVSTEKVVQPTFFKDHGGICFKRGSIIPNRIMDLKKENIDAYEYSVSEEMNDFDMCCFNKQTLAMFLKNMKKKIQFLRPISPEKSKIEIQYNPKKKKEIIQWLENQKPGEKQMTIMITYEYKMYSRTKLLNAYSDHIPMKIPLVDEQEIEET